MKEISLTQGMVAKVTDDWYEYLSYWKWHYQKSKGRNTGYAVRREGKRPNRKAIYMHNVITGTKDGQECDHKDGNGLNNQTYNLRNCTRTQNMANRVAYKNNVSGYKGVSRNKRDNNFRATIQVNHKWFHLGYYDTNEEAAHVYDTAALHYFGEFACLNFPKEHIPECPFCGSERSLPVGVLGNHFYHRCVDCGATFFVPDDVEEDEDV